LDSIFQGLLDEPKRVPAGSEPHVRPSDTARHKRFRQQGSGIQAAEELILRGNSTQSRNTPMAARRNQTIGGSHPGGGVKQLRGPLRCPLSSARARIILAFCKSGHCLYLSKTVCCEAWRP